MNESIIKYDGPCEHCGENGTRYGQDKEGPHRCPCGETWGSHSPKIYAGGVQN